MRSQPLPWRFGVLLVLSAAFLTLVSARTPNPAKASPNAAIVDDNRAADAGSDARERAAQPYNDGRASEA